MIHLTRIGEKEAWRHTSTHWLMTAFFTFLCCMYAVAVDATAVEITLLKSSDLKAYNEAPRSKLRGITELNSEDFSEGEANPVASYGECQVQGSRAWDCHLHRV